MATNSPPQEDEFVWIREDHILAATQDALNEAVEAHGNKAKGIAWDVRSAFKRLLRNA